MRVTRLVVLALSAATATAAVLSTSPSTGQELASPVCVGAEVWGTIIDPHEIRLTCVATPLSTICSTQEIGLTPTLETRSTVCVPGG